jgi:long-chain acyl-CoA synthetase
MNSSVTQHLPRRIHEVLDEGALPGPNRIAFIDERGRKWSYADVISAVEKVAQDLANLGVEAGDRVMLVCENAITSIVVIYAASKLDAITAIINARQSEREVDAIREDCTPKVVVYTHIVSDAARSHGARHGAVEQSFADIGRVQVAVSKTPVDPIETFDDPAKQVAILIYTTGTTGRPKGVMLSHQNLLFVAARSKRVGKIGAADVGLSLMPIAHSYGFSTMQGHIFAGSRLFIMTRYDEERVIDLIASGTLTIFIAVPALYSRMVDTCRKTGRKLTPNSLRFMLTGTAPLDLALKKASEDLFSAVMENGYGLTETSPTISRSTYEIGSDDTSVGPPIAGVEIKLVDENGELVAPGEPGELWVRGPNVMLGYYGLPDATADIFDAQGFMNTGDVVRLDENGSICVEGRTKELIIRSGFNVYPVEVEAQLNAHPDVLNSAVVGCAVDGDETIVAFLEGTPGVNIDPEGVRSFVRERLTSYKVPSHFVVIDELPYSPNAKILKKQLKDRAADLIR